MEEYSSANMNHVRCDAIRKLQICRGLHLFFIEKRKKTRERIYRTLWQRVDVKENFAIYLSRDLFKETFNEVAHFLVIRHSLLSPPKVKVAFGIQLTIT